jgi:predicted acetyltransferase
MSPKAVDYRAPSDDTEQRAYAWTLMQSLVGNLPPPGAEGEAWYERWCERTAALTDVRVACVRERGRGRVAGGLVVVPMGHFLCGRPVRTAAISAVAIAPEHRSQGVATQMMTECLREERARGVPLSTLYPASWSLYRRVGYEVAGSHRLSTIPLDRLPGPSAHDDARFEISPFDEDRDRPEVETLYATWARGQQGALDRGPWMWRRILRAMKPGKYDRPFAYVFRRDARLVAYVVFVQDTVPAMGYELLVLDFVGADRDAILAVWRLLGAHRSMSPHLKMHVSSADPRILMLKEPPRNSITHSLDWVARVLDVELALSARAYPNALACELRLDVRDAVLPENAGEFVVRVEGGRGAARRSTSTGAPCLKLDVRALGALYTGRMSARALRDLGLLDGDEEGLDVSTAIFAAPAPWLGDMF